ncbi:MAG: Maf family nucleotide pyrophosphatase [Bacteroidales bacterium]
MIDPLKKKLGNKRIVLASKSPRRQELLEVIVGDYELRAVDVEEQYPSGLQREQIAVYLAELKAAAFSNDKIKAEELIITADTIVCQGHDVLPKPVGRDDAFRILSALSGEKHEVYTGVCLKSAEKISSFYACSVVEFRVLRAEEIHYYLDNFHPYDKAGAYGIQEWIGYIGVESISGSYYNVMGLPTQKLYEALLKF